MAKKKGWRKPIDLTTTEYMKLKKNGMTDVQIALMCDVSSSTMKRWKQEHGMAGIALKSQETIKPFTERGEKRLKELIRRVEELRAAYWSNEAIAKELNTSMYTVQNIITTYFPEQKRKAPRKYTTEQKARAKKAGVDMRTVGVRVGKGMDVDEALDTPVKRKKFFTKKQGEIIKKCGVNRTTVMSRMKRGMSFKAAISYGAFEKPKEPKK